MTAITWIGLIGIVMGACAFLALKRFADSREFFIRVAESRFLSESCKEWIFACRSMSFSPMLLPILLLAIRKPKKADRDKLLAEVGMDSKEYKICLSAFLRTLSVNATAYMPLYFVVAVLLALRVLVRVMRQQTNSFENTIATFNSSLNFMGTAFARKFGL